MKEESIQDEPRPSQAKDPWAWRAFDLAFPSLCCLGFLTYKYVHLRGSTIDFPSADPLTQLIESFEMHRSALVCWYYNRGGHPPLQPAFSSMCYSLFGESELVAYLSVAFFSAFAAFPLYLGGRWLAGRPAGILAVMLFFASPFTTRLSELYLCDTSMASMVAFFTACWLLSRGGEHRGWTLLAGFALGLGLLAKYSILFLVIPLIVAPLSVVTIYLVRSKDGLALAAVLTMVCAVFVPLLLQTGPNPLPTEAWLAVAIALLYRAFRGSRSTHGTLATSRQRAINILTAAALTLVLALPWYQWRTPALLSCYYDNWRTVGTFEMARSGILRYFFEVVLSFFGGNMILLPLAALFPLAAKRNRSGIWLLFASTVLGFALVSRINTPESRHLYGLLPLLIFCSVAWLQVVRYRVLAVVLLLSLGLLQVLFVLNHPASLSWNLYLPNPSAHFPDRITKFRNSRSMRPYLERFREDVRMAVADRSHSPRILLAADDQTRLQGDLPDLTTEHLLLILLQEGFELRYVDLAWTRHVATSGDQEPDWVLVVTAPDRQPEGQAFPDCATRLELIRKLAVHPGLEVRVYRFKKVLSTTARIAPGGADDR